jgi:hypothetical protein
MSNPRSRHEVDKKRGHGFKAGTRTKSFPRWLRAAAPVAVRVETVDGEEKTIRVKPAKEGGSIRWNVLVETIESLHPSRVEALAEEGESLGQWEFPPDDGPQTMQPAAGYAYDAGDTEKERELKTIAHLISDAYKTSIEALVKVTSLQSQHFTEERRHMASAMSTQERILSRIAKEKGQRVRVTSASEIVDDEEETEEASVPDDFMQTMGPIVMQAMQRYMANQSGGTPTAQANGAASPKEGAS